MVKLPLIVLNHNQLYQNTSNPARLGQAVQDAVVEAVKEALRYSLFSWLLIINSTININTIFIIIIIIDSMCLIVIIISIIVSVAILRERLTMRGASARDCII